MIREIVLTDPVIVSQISDSYQMEIVKHALRVKLRQRMEEIVLKLNAMKGLY